MIPFFKESLVEIKDKDDQEIDFIELKKLKNLKFHENITKIVDNAS
jgi:hypothetical protein